MFKRILVPLDGSQQSEKAIPVAARIARASNGTLVFVHVVLSASECDASSREHPIVLKPGVFRRREEEALRYLEPLLREYANELESVNTEIDLTTGAAAPEIYSLANLEKIDLVVLCGYGEKGLQRWIFGSVAREGIRHSPISVLVLNMLLLKGKKAQHSCNFELS